jgi:predicted transposase/invertase (TIGR01784 family)
LEEIEMLATKSPEMKKTATIIKRLSADERMRLEIADREKAMRDQLSLVVDSIAEGRIEGRAEERTEMVRNMLSHGISPSDVSKISGMAIDEITALRDL